MAYAYLKALGCDGDIGVISVDFSAGLVNATEAHKVIHGAVSKSGDVDRATGAATLEIESSRYPFCFFGNATSPDATRGMIEFIPFNNELNRFKLVVRNAGSDRLKVTWGSASKQYTPEQLSAGINLAAEFPDNPFSEAFKKGEDAIRKQQEFETPMIKQVGHVTDLLPEEADTVEKLMAAAKKREDQLFTDARASIAPVRHRIVIEPVK
jgi:hypothetical protein